MTKDFSWLSRTQLLIGEEALQKLAASHVLIVGLGGVGVPFVREEALATVRISVLRPDLGWTDTPACHVFGDDPNFQSIAGTSYVEASRLCFAHTARRDAFYGLLGHMAATAERFAVEWLAAHGAKREVWDKPNKQGWTPMRIAEGYRFGNFKPSPETEAVVRKAMEKAGVSTDAGAPVKNCDPYGKFDCITGKPKF